MSPRSMTGDFLVLAVGAVLCATPAITRPTLQFGVRIPAEHASAPIVRHQRRVYYWRTGAIGVCCITAAVLSQDYGSWWLSRVILLIEVAADLGCFWTARNRIRQAKSAAGWFTGRRQVVTADTSWRTDLPGFPVLWLIPAVMVTALTIAIGAVRYPGLPAHLTTGLSIFGASRRSAPKSPFSVFAIVAGQLYVTVLWAGLMVMVYRSRPDIEATDAAASTGRYRKFLTATTKTMLTLIALVDLSLLLAALRNWQVYRLAGIGSFLPLLPFMVGVVLLAATAVRVGQGGSRLAGRRGGLGSATVIDRDDDQFWKGGLVYVNRDDPAIMVGNRFGFGWTFNLGNRSAWLVIAGIVGAPAGLAAISVAAGM